MAYYNTCSRCGANLDPGELCDCEQEEKRTQEIFSQKMRVSSSTGQLSFIFDRKDAGYATKSVI